MERDSTCYSNKRQLDGIATLHCTIFNRRGKKTSTQKTPTSCQGLEILLPTIRPCSLNKGRPETSLDYIYQPQSKLNIIRDRLQIYPQAMGYLFVGLNHITQPLSKPILIQFFTSFRIPQATTVGTELITQKQ